VNDPHPRTGFCQSIRAVSTGVKLVIVSGLALLMTIPSFYVSSLVEERTQRARDVATEISSHVGGQQTFLGPTLAIPYTVPAQPPSTYMQRGAYFVFPAQANAAITTTTEERHRSLFKVPVFQADLKLDATFDLDGVPASAPPGAQLDWSHAEFLIGVSDARGALSDGSLTLDGKTSALIPSTLCPETNFGRMDGDHIRLVFFGASAASVAQPAAHFSVSSSLRFSGAQRIALLPYGKTTRVSMQGDWRNPGFDGGFLPVSRTVTPTGFTAEWHVPFIARGVRAEGTVGFLNSLTGAALGVSFVEVADPYQSVNRSLKFVLLFLGLIFLSYFVFEVTTGKRVHVAQYILIGVAQIIFYLLLLSLAERTGFDLGFLIAGSATVILLSLNAGWVFASHAEALKAFVAFSLLYALIYLLLRLEDNALLIGAIASFIAVAVAMYVTRRIDWYSSPSPETAMKTAHEA
jgi:inner membrane protein